MKVLAIGDVCGKAGSDFILKRLPQIKKNTGADLVIVNGENSSEGNGILPASAELLFSAGADVITGGNHTLRRREIYDMLGENPFLLRPANYPDTVPGCGIAMVDLGYTIVAVINLMGVVYLDNLPCPFETADRMIAQAHAQGAKIIVVDFHAEATSEKRAMGFYLDGRVSALFGTHTHVPTADAQLLPAGTAYITDIGMTGVHQSVLGVDKDIIIRRLKDKLPEKFRNAAGPVVLSGCLLDIDHKTGKATSITPIQVFE